MDIFFYSQYCRHSTTLLQFIVKNSLNDKLNFMCIDKRREENNCSFIPLENGEKYIIPPCVRSVPCLISIQNKYQVYTGITLITDYLTLNHNLSIHRDEPVSSNETVFSDANSVYKSSFQMNTLSDIPSDNAVNLEQIKLDTSGGI